MLISPALNAAWRARAGVPGARRAALHGGDRGRPWWHRVIRYRGRRSFTRGHRLAGRRQLALGDAGAPVASAWEPSRLVRRSRRLVMYSTMTASRRSRRCRRVEVAAYGVRLSADPRHVERSERT